MTQNKSDPVIARPSATVVLVRESPTAPEILMVRRRAGDAFGGSYAFPGGVVDDDESAAQTCCRGLSVAQANTILGLGEDGLNFYSAAARELFEETGVLLARDLRGEWAFSGEPNAAARLRQVRGDLDERRVSWAEMLRTNDLSVACDALHYFSFWETPVQRPKRWAARFFLAEMPLDQEAQHDGKEVTDSCWMTAEEVVSMGQQGGMSLPFPTLTTLKKIAGFRTVEHLLRWGRDQAARGVTKIRPVIIENNGKTRFLIPGDPDYPAHG